MRKLPPLAAVLLTCNFAPMQAESLPGPSQVDKLVHSFNSGRRSALVIGLTDGRHHRFRFYGIVSRRQCRVPDESTEFEIGSLSKVLTGLSLASLVQSNRVSLSDPVQKFLPQDFKTPTLGGSEIKLVHLATHTSGLPRDCGSALAQRNETGPQLAARLERCRLLFSPGSAFSYSNIGYEVLGQAIAAAAHENFDRVVGREVLSRLGLRDTRIHLNAQQSRRLADGHDDTERVTPPSTCGGTGASGGFRSTAKDLLALLDAEMSADVGGLGSTMESANEPRVATPSGYYSCLGWFFDPDAKVYVKTGSLAGFRSYLAFSKARRIGVVILSASRQTDVYSLGDTLIGVKDKTHPEDITAKGVNAQ